MYCAAPYPEVSIRKAGTSNWMVMADCNFHSLQTALISMPLSQLDSWNTFMFIPRTQGKTAVTPVYPKPLIIIWPFWSMSSDQQETWKKTSLTLSLALCPADNIELEVLGHLQVQRWPSWGCSINMGPGGRLNKKDGLTRYGNSHVKDKTS